ncbi:MAG: lipopolysaccharide biosynthesis protein, partial [Pyrinomonadaceae bacterium]
MRSKRATINYFSQVLLTGVTMVVGFVSTPFLLHWLGAERFGAVRVANELYGHLVLLELGLSGALPALFARALHKNDSEGIKQIVAAGIRAYTGVWIVMLLSGIVILVFINKIIPVSPEYVTDLRIGCAIVIVGLYTITLSPFRLLTDARQRAYRISLYILVQSLVITAFSLVFAASGWGIKGQTLALFIGASISPILLAREGSKMFPGSFSLAIRGQVDRRTSREMWSLNKPTVVYDVCRRVSFFTDNIVIAWIMGPTFIVFFFVTQRLGQLAQVQLQGLGMATWAGMAEIYAHGENDLFNHRLIELTRIVATLSIAVLLPIAAYNRYFTAIWVGQGYYGGDLLTGVTCLNALLVAVIYLWGWCFTGTAQINRLVPAVVIQTSISFILSIVLTWFYGVVGPPLAWLIGNVVIGVWLVPLQLKRTFGVSLTQLA